MAATTPEDVRIATLGECRFDSPLHLSTIIGDGIVNYITDDTGVRYEVEVGPAVGQRPDVLFEKAGPRQRIFYDPGRTAAAVVTCGGLCPGINNVIRSIVLQLYYGYGVCRILGMRYGYQGIRPDAEDPPLPLTPDAVEHIHRRGGTILGASRGPGEIPVMVRYLADEKIDMIFCIGGDGTQRGAHAIATEIRRRGLPIAVIGVPKTIDNDVPYVERSFGFATAIEQARAVIDSAHVEARDAVNGISIVKLMGRHAGFIAAAATAASQDVNFTLIPELPFKLEGEGAFLPLLEKRVLDRHHAVVVVAEGAGQDLVGADENERDAEGRAARDASGNVRLEDVGSFLKRHISAYFRERGVPVTVRYLDPSYAIRSVAADAGDAILCDRFARGAADAAMAGKTDVLIGLQHGAFIHVPLELVTREARTLDLEGDLWRAVMECTGQPARMG
jgi:6-phosphofructokinase 1